jgi:dTMP kinase
MSEIGPLFITLEGGEGAGKSTLLKRIESWFNEEKWPFYSTREPGGTSLAEEIRALLLEKREEPMSIRAELFLFLAARADHMEKVILPKLKSGITVLSDRFQDSTLAYQGVARGLGVDIVRELLRFAQFDKEPDITLFLDIDPDLALARTASRKHDRMEKEGPAFHKRVYDGFVQLAKQFPKRIIRLNGLLSEDSLFQEAKDAILRHRSAH